MGTSVLDVLKPWMRADVIEKATAALKAAEEIRATLQ
jgi:hypothetical protein